MKLWIGLLVSLLVATACLVACGDSDDGPGVRNAALLTSETTEVKVSSGDGSKGDSDYNDLDLQYQHVCDWGDDGKMSRVYLTFLAKAGGATFSNHLQVRFPSLPKVRVTRLGSQAFLHDTVYITSEGTAERLCDDPDQALVVESEANRRQILEALESANAKAKGGAENVPLEKLLSPTPKPSATQSQAGASEADTDASDADAFDFEARIELLVLGREGESSNDLNARREAILGELSLPLEPSLLDEGSSQQPININTNLCPSRREAMRSSHPHGPYVLLIELTQLGVSGGFPQICFLGHDIGLQNAEEEVRPVLRWGARVYCNHPHGVIELPEGSRCRDLNLE